ncbi:MAG: hypothetical protein U0X74_04355 [Anaerolineales bacterium]
MEFEQIVKRLEFLDKQQRETKETLVSLKESLASFETTVNAVSKQIKTLSKQVADITPATKRVDQFETMVGKQRNELVKMIEDVDKSHTRSERDTAKQFQSDVNELTKALNQLESVQI